VNHTGYTTDLITDKSIAWMQEQAQGGQPFMLMSQHKAPHGRWEPALRHLTLYDGIDIPEPSTLRDNYQGRASGAARHEMGILEHMNPYRLMIQYSSKFTPEQFSVYDGYFRPQNKIYRQAEMTDDQRLQWHYQRYIKNYLRCVTAVDENVTRLLNYLEASGLARNTVVIYSSDQGFYLGDHGWFDKRWMYEPSLHTPLIVRWPGVVRAGSQNTDIALNLDFPATFLDIAGIPIPSQFQGRSLVPLLQGRRPDDWRTTMYYHYYEAGVHGVPRHEGVRNQQYKLIHYYDLGEWELFDLARDPNELVSVYGQPAYHSVQTLLERELITQKRQLQVAKP